jgi:hypothetical protein
MVFPLGSALLYTVLDAVTFSRCRSKSAIRGCVMGVDMTFRCYLSHVTLSPAGTLIKYFRCGVPMYRG